MLEDIGLWRCGLAHTPHNISNTGKKDLGACRIASGRVPDRDRGIAMPHEIRMVLGAGTYGAEPFEDIYGSER